MLEPGQLAERSIVQCTGAKREGHGGLKDLIFGNAINPVRHNLDIPC
jgi:hypothetical protein